MVKVLTWSFPAMTVLPSERPRSFGARNSRATASQQPVLRIIPIEQPAKAAKHRTFFSSTPAGLRRSRGDAACQAAERERLQPDVSRPAQRREEQSFAAEKRALDLPDKLNVVIDTWLKGHDT